MKENYLEIYEAIYENEAKEAFEEAMAAAKDTIRHFKEIAPTRKPNLSEYMSYLNKIEKRLEASKLRSNLEGEIALYLPGKRLNELFFSPDSIAWVWEHDYGHRTRKSVRFYKSQGMGHIELEVSELNRKYNIDPLTTTTIIIGNEATAWVTQTGVQSVVPLDRAIPLFPKPKR